MHKTHHVFMTSPLPMTLSLLPSTESGNATQRCIPEHLFPIPTSRASHWCFEAGTIYTKERGKCCTSGLVWFALGITCYTRITPWPFPVTGVTLPLTLLALSQKLVGWGWWEVGTLAGEPTDVQDPRALSPPPHSEV